MSGIEVIAFSRNEIRFESGHHWIPEVPTIYQSEHNACEG